MKWIRVNVGVFRELLGVQNGESSVIFVLEFDNEA